MAQLVLNKHEQLEALFSSVRLDVVAHLELYGPSSIAEVAEELARTPHSLYHHFRKLLELGIIRIESMRRSGSREEAVYDVRGRPVVVRYEPAKHESRALMLKAATHCLRQAGRDYQDSLESAQGEASHPELRRYRMRLEPSTVDKIKQHLNAVVDLILNERVSAAQGSAKSKSYAWVSMWAPLNKDEQIPSKTNR